MKTPEFKIFFSNLNNSKNFVLTNNRYLLFSPALFLVLLGVAVILMPRLFLFLIATFFLTMGLILAVVIWKVVQFKNRVDNIVKDFNGKVVVQGLNVFDPAKRSAKDMFSDELTTIEVDQNDSKKIIYH